MRLLYCYFKKAYKEPALTIWLFSVLTFFISIFAGVLGALTGLGGGAIVIAILVLFFQVDIHIAMGASLICAIATSSGTAAAYLREGLTNLRLGLLLETGAVIGAFIGAMLIAVVPKTALMMLFSLVLLFSAYLAIKRHEDLDTPSISHPWSVALKLNSQYTIRGNTKKYLVQRIPLGIVIMTLAGTLSGLLGIGSGTLKVLVMDQTLRLPYKVATTTSQFMIGITAAVSAGIYFAQGYINPVVTCPIMLGVILGSLIGTKLLVRLENQLLRLIFSISISLIALQMLYRALTGAT